jgi:hypothetical protein
MSSLTPEERKRRLDEARRALRSGDARQMLTALDRLPTTGTKADDLRAELRARIGSGGSVIPLPLPVPHPRPSVPSGTAIQASSNNRILFVDRNLAAGILFRVRMRGGIAEIAVNVSHPAYRFLAERDGGGLGSVGEHVLRAWATLHLEAGSDKKRERIDDLAADWARALGALDATARDDDESMG